MGYDGIAKLLHWLVAALVILLLIGGGLLEELPDAEKSPVAGIHGGIGIVVLLLMIARLIWRLTHPAPSLEHLPGWQRIAARTTHWAFYVLVVLQPIWGMAQARYSDFVVAPFGLFQLTGPADPERFELFHELHELTASLIMLLVVLHVAAALYHQFVRKDATLRRMTWGNVDA